MCFRYRTHKLRVKARKLAASRQNQQYTKLGEEEKEDPIQLEDRRSAIEMGKGKMIERSDLEEVLMSGAQVEHQGSERQAFAAPEISHIMLEEKSETGMEIQSRFDRLSIPHDEETGLFLPPPVAFQGSSRRSTSPDYSDGYEHEYDGRTGKRYERSRTPSPDRLVLSRSASMLKPR